MLRVVLYMLLGGNKCGFALFCIIKLQFTERCRDGVGVWWSFSSFSVSGTQHPKSKIYLWSLTRLGGVGLLPYFLFSLYIFSRFWYIIFIHGLKMNLANVVQPVWNSHVQPIYTKKIIDQHILIKKPKNVLFMSEILFLKFN